MAGLPAEEVGRPIADDGLDAPSKLLELELGREP